MFFLCMRNVFSPNRNKTVFTSNVNSGLQYNTIQYNTNLISFLFYAIIFSLNQHTPTQSIWVCSHKVFAVGFNTLCYDAERRSINPCARIKLHRRQSVEFCSTSQRIIEYVLTKTHLNSLQPPRSCG